ncbi:hypothetical protein [Deinococcus sonorensis]|uniref:DNA methylase N-4/N-6 domain-containing protein n=2 Tax=Deinococcus sonorensis TaxID=309891 RepID=A0AAU7UH41_9DEIO
MPEQAAAEALHPTVARAIIATYTPHKRSSVVDPMAGTGTVAQAAMDLGHQVRASDLHPRLPLIEAGDATKPSHLQPGSADLVVLHPPTYETWRASARTEDGLDAYLEFLRTVLEQQRALARPGGHVVLVVRPVQQQGRTTGDARGPLLLGARSGEVRAVHVAFARDGGEAWHILAFQIPIPEAASTELPGPPARTPTPEDRGEGMAHRPPREERGMTF